MSHPSQVLTDAVAAIERGDWQAFIALCDPVSVRRFRNDVVWQLSDHGYSPGVTVEDFMSENPDMPRQVAEYNVAQMEQYRDPALRMELEISTVSSLDKLKSLEPHEVLVRWLQSRMPYREDEFSIRKWEPARGMEVTEVRRISQEEIEGDFIYRPPYEILGSVRDGPDFAHVVCRHADRRDHEAEESDSEDYATPPDEAELDRAIRNRVHMLTALCRKQPDGNWLLIAERNLFFLPQMSILT